MKKYPCEIKNGDIMVTKGNRKWTVDHFDGNYIFTVEGAQYKPKHPDIIGFDDAIAEEETSERKRGRKKKNAEPVIEESEVDITDAYKAEAEYIGAEMEKSEQEEEPLPFDYIPTEEEM